MIKDIRKPTSHDSLGPAASFQLIHFICISLFSIDYTTGQTQSISNIPFSINSGVIRVWSCDCIMETAGLKDSLALKEMEKDCQSEARYWLLSHSSSIARQEQDALQHSMSCNAPARDAGGISMGLSREKATNIMKAKRICAFWNTQKGSVEKVGPSAYMYSTAVMLKHTISKVLSFVSKNY